jgi:hypothetical protein
VEDCILSQLHADTGLCVLDVEDCEMGTLNSNNN